MVPAVNERVRHQAHPEYGFGLVRYVEEDAFGETRLQVAFDHLDNLQTVQPNQIERLSEPWEDAKAGQWGDVAIFRRKLAVGLILGDNNLTGVFTKAAIQPLPHQVHLVDRIISGNRFGHVLADDVGLGKTIEAGLIILSLMRREPPQRILIVCPKGLALQWQDELDDHFGHHFAIMGSNFDGKLASSWRTQSCVIAPIDRLKRDEYRSLLQEVGGFDLVICDEAHRLTAARNALTQNLTKTANYRLFEFLVQSRLIRHVENPDLTPRSPRLLLLSATPHQGDDERFVRLLHLARPDLFQPDDSASIEQLVHESLIETLTRTPKAHAFDWDGNPIFKGHRTTTLDVQWTPQEVALSRQLTQYILKSIAASRGTDRSFQLVVELVMHTFHKIAASSWAALRMALERRMEALGGEGQDKSWLPDEDDDEEEPATVGQSSQPFFKNEAEALANLLANLNLLDRDSKWAEGADLLREIDRQEPGAHILIFTQYRATQDFICERLRQIFPDAGVEVIHGDTLPEERREARRRFESNHRFLVSTEAGGEGVNLQKSCHIMINYDLPWNPMRLQQRIGRLDRYGQQHVVQVLNLRVPESWDNRISLRIHERLAVIERTMNLAGLVEDYQEMLLGQIAQQMDPKRLFANAIAGEDASDAEVDAWIQSAFNSAKRLQALLGDPRPVAGTNQRLRPALAGDDFRAAFALACEQHGLRLQETRNSANQFVPGVFNFRLPDAFRDPVFRPERTCHIVFDRDVFHQVRDQDLGRVRGQPIRPVLAGFGEPVTDWLFQTAMEAQAGESAFRIKAPAEWSHGEGWLLLYGLRWLGQARRLAAPDSLAVVFLPTNGSARLLSSREVFPLVQAQPSADPSPAFAPKELAEKARQFARDALIQCASNREPQARGSAGLSLMVVGFVSL